MKARGNWAEPYSQAWRLPQKQELTLQSNYEIAWHCRLERGCASRCPEVHPAGRDWFVWVLDFRHL